MLQLIACPSQPHAHRKPAPCTQEASRMHTGSQPHAHRKPTPFTQAGSRMHTGRPTRWGQNHAGDGRWRGGCITPAHHTIILSYDHTARRAHHHAIFTKSHTTTAPTTPPPHRPHHHRTDHTTTAPPAWERKCFRGNTHMRTYAYTYKHIHIHISNHQIIKSSIIINHPPSTHRRTRSWKTSYGRGSWWGC